MNEIILSDTFEQLKEEVARLQIILSGLIQEKDNLELHICPELQAEYNEKIGSLNNRILYQRLMVKVIASCHPSYINGAANNYNNILENYRKVSRLCDQNE